MRQIIAAAAIAVAVFSSGAAIAAEQEITLRVENMYCAGCPYMVKQALARVPGVSRIEVSYEAATALAMAVVVYEDSETDVNALTAATSELGFPSTPAR
jgi:mercuric ion binding protein